MRTRVDQDDRTAEPWPWERYPTILVDLGRAGVHQVAGPEGSSILVTSAPQSGGLSWLLWLVYDQPRATALADQAALVLAGIQIARLLDGAGPPTAWEEITQQKQMQRRLEEAAVVTGRLSHDFGNLLTGVLGFAELALAQVAPESAPYRFIHEIAQAAQKGAQIIQKLSWFSRRRPLGERTAALDPILAEEANRLRKKFSPPRDLRLEVAARLPALALDAESLRQVLVQLLDNAQEATGPGGVVTVTARPLTLTAESSLEFLGSPQAGEYVEVVVADNGCGFPDDFRQRQAAEIFYSTKPGHRGLGLAVVFGILRAHRGGLKIEDSRKQNATYSLSPAVVGNSQPGHMTRVRVVFPGAVAPLGVSEDRQGAAAPAREKILVVDDDPLTLEMVFATLTRSGFPVTSALGGAAALTAFREAGPNSFRLVLSDVIMPAMSGFDLARGLVDLDPEVKVLFITGQAPLQLPPGALGLRHFNWLAKPFRPEGLLKAVRAALDSG
jgi:signal transduction histidine kinase/CheY-like chemotaxis protein